MTSPSRGQALYAFWASFGWAAIDEESSYDENAMEELGDPDRFITFESAVGEIDDTLTLNASLWHRSPSWELIETKAAEIYDAIGFGGVKLAYEGGQLWITRGSNFAKRGASPDYNQRRILLTIHAEFLSA